MDSITRGNIVLKGDIVLESPLIIASGDSEKADIEIIKDAFGNPFIPATSFLGVLRHTFDDKVINDAGIKNFWGYSEKDNDKGETSIRQSDVICRDLFLKENFDSTIRDGIEKENFDSTIRDGIEIDNRNGLVIDKSKYDYEIIEPGASFCLYLEANINNNFNFLTKIFATINKYLEEGNLRIGAKTNSGFGKIRLQSAKSYFYNFAKQKDVIDYLCENESANTVDTTETFILKQKVFIIDSWFKLKTSLIIRSYSSDPDKPDAVHIRSKGKPVLPGTSIKGAIRARAEKIANTIFDEEVKAKELTNKLFGYVNTDNPEEDAVKGKILIDEQILPEFPEEIQSRIKIDRFTGGTIKGALFDTMPLWKDKTDKKINIKIIVRDYDDNEAGLLILVLKDLWTGDLPIGGEKSIGRGILSGIEARIVYNNEEILLTTEKSSKVTKHLTDIIKKINTAKEVKNG